MFRAALGDSLGFVRRSLRGTEWRQFLDYLSPAFFDVLPPRALWSQARTLWANHGDRERFDALRSDVARRLAERGIDVEIVGVAEASESARKDHAGGDVGAQAETEALGNTLLEIYFAQLDAADGALLDLRAGRVGAGRARAGRADTGGARAATASARTWLWRPEAIYVYWDADFLAAIRDLYRGFYMQRDDVFDEALRRLDLDAARDVFLAHFGDGEQRSVRFRTESFHASFHEAFVRCRDAGRSLHPDFVALGIYLACLYDGLEALERPFDVRAAYEKVGR